VGCNWKRDWYDISADLPELARTPVIVVSAGIKSILDIERTLQSLNGVPPWRIRQMSSKYLFTIFWNTVQ
jgi:pseudouridine-5'-phosphate glycosidase